MDSLKSSQKREVLDKFTTNVTDHREHDNFRDVLDQFITNATDNHELNQSR